LVTGSRFASAQASTGKGLTALVSKEDGGNVLRIGIIPAAKGAIAALNELGRSSLGDDQPYLLDVMQEQVIHFNKGGIIARIIAPVAIVASFNPSRGTWDLDDKGKEIIDLNDFLAILPLKDRFSLIVPVLRTTDPEEIRKFSAQKFNNINAKIPDYSEYLRKHIKYCKSKYKVQKLSKEAEFMLNEYYISIAKYGSKRVPETIALIAKMISMLKLKHTVDIEDAEETMNFYNKMLKYADEIIIKEVYSPKDLTIIECVKALKEIAIQFPISFEKMIDNVCANNEHVKNYIGEYHKLRFNHKLRSVLELLLQNYPHNIIKKGDSPIMLQWTEEKSN
jgi:DNA replicative helicase MCM subunit Mcm2 (Cdc46/Mcm family)